MHHSLSDRYKYKSKFSEIVLLTASVIFLATTFADSELYKTLGLQPDKSKLILGMTSVIAFIFSLVLLLLNWPEKAAQHKESADKWKVVTDEFRNNRQDNGEWLANSLTELKNIYLDALKYSIPIPDKVFNKLKVVYLSKVEVSKQLSKYPGVPYFIVWSITKITCIYKALRQK